MEAKDTVMTWKQTVECSHNPNKELRERDICLAQAEISFKAGQEAERERILNQMALERCDHDVMASFEDYYWFPKSVWQALKEGSKEAE